MASFNRVVLVGNLTRDPQLSYLPSNAAVCEFGMALNRKFRDKGGNQRDEVCYVDVASYGKQAETVNQYFRKGKPVLVEGRLRYREWTNKEGQKRSKLEVLMENFSFMDGGKDAGTDSGGHRTDARPQAAEESPPVDADIPF